MNWLKKTHLHHLHTHTHSIAHDGHKITLELSLGEKSLEVFSVRRVFVNFFVW